MVRNKFFDPANKVITGTSPQGLTGELDLILVANDQFGGEARTMLKIKTGKR